MLANGSALVIADPGLRVACMGLAFNANIEDFRESPARFGFAVLARKFGERIASVESYADALPIEFTDTGVPLVDIDIALHNLRRPRGAGRLRPVLRDRAGKAQRCVRCRHARPQATVEH